MNIITVLYNFLRFALHAAAKFSDTLPPHLRTSASTALPTDEYDRYHDLVSLLEHDIGRINPKIPNDVP
jgi:hypothetical protein